MTSEEKCKHHDEENGWCKKLSDWSDPMPHIEYCPKSPCEYAEPIEQPMTDNDIIKALGFCFAVGDCEHCAYADKPCQYLIGDALDLINRQKAEIERLTGYNENLRAANSDITNKLWDEVEEAKTEAIKEFAEKLRKSAFECDVSFGYGKEHYTEAVAVVEIDNLVKELTEDKNETG